MTDRDLKPENVRLDARTIAKMRALVDASKDPRAPAEFTGALALAVPGLLDEVESLRAALAEALNAHENTLLQGVRTDVFDEALAGIGFLRSKFLRGDT